MKLFALSFNHIETVNGERVQVHKFVPISPEQASGSFTVTEIPTPNTGDVITLSLYKTDITAQFKAVGPNLFRYLLPSDVAANQEGD